ncbi:MAG: metalloregulator ArsR/SmtB family transcription factor [Myxococcota bacterium]
MQPSGYALGPNPALDSVFAALSDPTRRRILARLVEGEASVGELAAPFSMSQPAISKHLKVLEHAGLVERSVDGTRRPARLRPEPLAAANTWLESYRALWEAKFEQLDTLLRDLARDESRRKDDA